MPAGTKCAAEGKIGKRNTRTEKTKTNSKAQKHCRENNISKHTDEYYLRVIPTLEAVSQGSVQSPEGRNIAGKEVRGHPRRKQFYKVAPSASMPASAALDPYETVDDALQNKCPG